MDKLAKGESEVESVEQLFTKIKNDFGEILEEERKIEQLRTIEQGGRTCNKYVQEFKKVTRGSGYEGRPLIEEFKQGLNGAIRRNVACPGGNAQPREEGSYGGRGGQIMWRTGGEYRGRGEISQMATY